MKRTNTLKQLLFVTLLCLTGVASAQIHPLAFGTAGGYTNSNYYADYVGLRFQVTAPGSIAGDYVHAAAVVGTASGDWPSIVYTPIINQPVIMPPKSDSAATSSFAPGSMTGKICLLWRGPLVSPGPVSFSQKAQYAQDAGAIACVIINEYPGGAPFAPGYTTGFTVHIPVIMIGNYDGIAIENVYDASAPGTVKMTITPWGQSLTNDLGIVPTGGAAWHDYAIPYDQLSGTGVSAYKGLDGAFVANYGTATQTNVKVSGTLSFTPSGTTTPIQLHTDTVKLPTFTVADSIWAMFDTLTSNNEYDVTLTTPAKGRFDLTYNISEANTDDYSGDNKWTTSFFATDSLYSKGSYNFVTNQPVRTSYRGGATTAQIWGNMYYVAKGGALVSRVQYSLDATATGPFSEPGNNVYLFKWVDGDRGLPKDSLVQNGELELVGAGTKSFDGINDTSQALLEVRNMGIDTGTPGTGHFVVLQSNTWYYLAVGIPPAYYLGCDGIQDPFPRIYGRHHAVNHIYEYSNLQFGEPTGSEADIYTNFAANNNPMPADVQHIAVDSFNFNNSRSLLPAIAMIINKDTSYVPPIIGGLVKNQSKPAIGISLSPNPSSEVLNVSLDLDKFAASVKYTLIDGMGRIVSETVHTNLQSEKYSINTSVLASGNYFLVVNANDKVTFKKFVVAR